VLERPGKRPMCPVHVDLLWRPCRGKAVGVGAPPCSSLHLPPQPVQDLSQGVLSGRVHQRMGAPRGGDSPSNHLTFARAASSGRGPDPWPRVPAPSAFSLAPQSPPQRLSLHVLLRFPAICGLGARTPRSCPRLLVLPHAPNATVAMPTPPRPRPRPHTPQATAAAARVASLPPPAAARAMSEPGPSPCCGGPRHRSQRPAATWADTRHGPCPELRP
jgi:hypothetical protein